MGNRYGIARRGARPGTVKTVTGNRKTVRLRVLSQYLRWLAEISRSSPAEVFGHAGRGCPFRRVGNDGEGGGVLANSRLGGSVAQTW